MSNTAVLANKLYVERNTAKKSWTTKVKEYLKENQGIIIAGLLSMNGRIDTNTWSAINENNR